MFGLKDGKENEGKYTLADKCILSLLQAHYYFYKETVYQKTNCCKKFALSRWLSFRFRFVVNICKYLQLQ
jgi:hypothetical protein